MENDNAVLTFNGVMEYQLWAAGAGAHTDILHVTERGGQLVVTYRGELALETPEPVTAAAAD